jgi:putative GTP pyrophosphokinase
VSTDAVRAMVEDFETKVPLFQDYVDKVGDLVAELLDENDIKVHSIESRVKDKQSLESKLLRPGSNYSALDHVTDLCGVRIITHFADDVYEIAQVIESEFSIDESNSVDKNVQLDPD